ncbi:transporter substrate-binding domain-containing protein [Hahella sp. KA22]|uniref:substrate-binding periplasmic protein n=1 Tax=Hahella sp. KA22 TaxID=1628392 RepID=UPI000FDD2A80|nr:transporter substrate-binding domain-containing protein [Hahella sp. KA22]AZZ92469.1 transporter substrate-binding domain-containing protein [Hahella sp. KA22]QAY55843.1 transporter substrate-binding domain-containing protein [Hahella sp. KA22]
MVIISSILKRIFLAFSILTCAHASAETIKISNGEWAPFTSQSYKHFGLASHIVSEAFKAAGVDVEYVFYPWARALIDAKEGKELAATIVWTYSDERAQDFLYTDPVFALQSVFFHKKGKVVDWQNLSELKDYKFGAAISYSYGDEFNKLEEEGVFNVARIANDSNNLKKLVSGRIDLYPAEMLVGLEMIKNELSPSEAEQITYSKPYRESDYFVLVSKKYPGSSELVKKFNEGLAKIKESGLYQKMMDDSIQGNYSP